MDANQRVINRLERLYSLYGAGDFVDSVVSIGGHAYRKDIRQAAYRFINMHLKNDPRVVLDSEVDLATGPRGQSHVPHRPGETPRLPRGLGHPQGSTQHDHRSAFRANGQGRASKAGRIRNMASAASGRASTGRVRVLPRANPAGKFTPAGLASEPGITIHCSRFRRPAEAGQATRILLFVNYPKQESVAQAVLRVRETRDQIYVCTPRGVGETLWTQKNPPNYVERSHVLLGRTVDAGRVWDIIATVRALRAKYGDMPVCVAGEGPGAVLAAYAALLEPDIAYVTAINPPVSHMDARAPQFLNVLRVCDIPDAFGMLAPRPLILQGYSGEALKKVTQIYASAGAAEKLVVKPDAE